MYVSHMFAQHPLDEDESWYSDSDIHALARLANGLFIFAATAIAYILDTNVADDRIARLKTTLSAMKNSKVATRPLDDLYEFVITRATNTTKVEPLELARTQLVLVCILVSHMPLSLVSLAELLGNRAAMLLGSLRRLRSVMHVPNELDQPGLRTLHASFGDYLFERAAPRIRINRSLEENALAN